jgi:simple sugar transport system ATP-binding protein
VVLITHKLDEVMDISDTVTVMRGGETVGMLPTSDATAAGLARMMVGRDVSLVSLMSRHPAPGMVESEAPHEHVSQPVPALEVRDLVAVRGDGHRALDGVSFSVSGGEVLGIAGVEGNGQTELIETIAGLHPLRSGSIHLASRDVTTAPVRERADGGLSHVPEDRHRRGLVLDYTIADNLILGQQHRFSSRGVIDRSRVEANARRHITAFDIRPAAPGAWARGLSGGNQQKVVFAREVGRDFTVLLASQPTRGVDVGGIEFIHARIRAARDAGKAVLLVSADLAEILALSDRIAVLYGGRLVITLPRARASAETLGPYMTGVQTGDGRRETT